MPRASRRSFLKTTTVETLAVAGLSCFAQDRLTAQTIAPSGGNIRRSEPKGNDIGCPPAVRAALSGPWPSISTPFTQQGEIDFDALRKQLDFLIAAGAKAVVLTWGDSLYSILTEDEIAQVTKAVVQHVNRRTLVVAADGSWWTGKAVEFAKYCATVGADMLMVKPPDWAASTTVDSLVAHYRAVAEHIPVMLVTNTFGPRGQGFGLDVCRRLYREVPGIVAVKDDLGGEFICKLCLMTHDRWAVCAGGQKQNHLLMLPYGVDGYLSTFLHFKPEIAWRYWKAVESGDLATARDVVRDYDMPLFDYLLKSEGSFDAAIHGILELCGRGKRYRRSPYYSLNDKQMNDLSEFLQKRKML